MADIKKPLIQKPVDKNLSTTPNPLYNNQMLSTGALEEINRLKQPISSMPSAISPQFIPQTNVIRNASLQMIPQEPKPEDDTNYLGSLIAQGVTGLGIGLMGGSPWDIQHSANTFQSMRDKQTNEKKAKLYTDPNSEESKKRRLVYSKALGIEIPSEFSYTDLNDPTVLQSIRDKSAQARLASMPKQGGVSGAGKPEKEIKSNQKSIAEYREHVANLAEMGNVLNKIKLLNRTGIGTITPDFSVDTQAYSSSLDRAAQPMIKTLAGPGTLQKEERDTYGKLVPTGNTRADLALRQANDIILEGTQKSLTKMNTDLNTGDISKKDYDALINEYNEQLSKKGIGINQIINPNTGRLEPRTKSEVELKDGRRAIVDQFGYTWE